MEFSSSNRLASVYDDLMQSLRALQELSRNRFLPALLAAGSAAEWYDVIYALDNAAHSKELRDEWDERIHSLLNEISVQIDVVNALERIKLSPSSTQQQQSWVAALSRDPRGKYAFGRSGSLDISLRDSHLYGTSLHVQRIWDGGAYSGTRVNFQIKLDNMQIVEFKERSAQLRAFDTLIVDKP